MENQTPFDLNLAIQAWRENLANSPAFRSENLNELESHLRDSIDRLRARELSDEEAFLIATRRIGNAQRLEHEFGKVNGAASWFDRYLWFLVAIQVWILVSTASLALMSAALQSATDPNEMFPLVLAIVFSPIPIAIVTASVFWCFIWPKRSGSSPFQKLLYQPAGMALTLFILGALFTFITTWALQTWYYPIMAQHAGYSEEMPMRVFNLRLPYLAFWAVVTFLIARKRLRSAVA